MSNDLAARRIETVKRHMALEITHEWDEVIATFDYSYMIFVVFWGYVFFAEVPDLWTLAGMALISAGGLGVLMIRDRGPSRP